MGLELITTTRAFGLAVSVDDIDHNYTANYTPDTAVCERHGQYLHTKHRENIYVLENLVPCLTTFSTASKKSRSEATFRRARIANMSAYE